MRDFPPGLLPGPFTVAQARAAGVGEGMLRSHRVRAVLTGVYVAAGVPDSLDLRCRAVCLLAQSQGRTPVFCQETAVLLHRLPLPMGVRDPLVRVVISGKVRQRIAGVVGYRATLADGDVVQRGGFLVTSVERTWCDLAASGWQRLDLVAYADAVLRRSSPPDRAALAAAVDRWDRRRGVGALREALGLCRARVDSPMETRLRLLLHDAGLPTPEVNVPVLDDDGLPLHTPDLCWPRWRYAVDYDGEHHLRVDADAAVVAQRRDNWRRRQDVARQELLRDQGWVLRVVTAYEVLREPQRLVTVVRAGFCQAQARARDPR